MRKPLNQDYTIPIHLPRISDFDLMLGIRFVADSLEMLYIGREDDERAGTMLQWLLDALMNEHERRELERVGEFQEVQTLKLPLMTNAEAADALRDIQVISYTSLPIELAEELVDPLVQAITLSAIVRLKQ